MVQALDTKVITPNMNTIIFRSSYEVERLKTCFHLPGGGDEIDQKNWSAMNTNRLLLLQYLMSSYSWLMLLLRAGQEIT